MDVNQKSPVEPFPGSVHPSPGGGILVSKLDDEVLADGARQLFGDIAGRDIGALTRRVGNHDLHGPDRIGWRRRLRGHYRSTRGQRQQGRLRQQARGQPPGSS